MGLFSSLYLKYLSLLPTKKLQKKKAPFLQKHRYPLGANHPAIKLNAENYLTCLQYCGTCPSYSGVKGEALYCATGPSTKTIEKKGCNCVMCPIFDKCGGKGIVYFCVNGQCKSEDPDLGLTSYLDKTKKYLERFMTFKGKEDNSLTNNSLTFKSEEFEIHEVEIDFIGDKKVKTDSDTSILDSSLNAGIDHAHICGGRARCSTCRVAVTEGLEHCKPRNDDEKALAEIKGFTPEIRLACQTKAGDNISLRRLVLDDADIAEAISQGRAQSSELGKEVEVSILFSDIRSFTSFSEKALPYDIIHILNRYFDAIGARIDKYGGYIDKYMGDGIMVIFGLENKHKEHHAKLAALAALEMQEALEEFNKYLESQFQHKFRSGIGIHTGTAIIGNLGFNKKKEYTALGDTVNTASRIESLTSKSNTKILVSESTYHQIKLQFNWGKAYKAKVKGKEEALLVCELLSERGD